MKAIVVGVVGVVGQHDLSGEEGLEVVRREDVNFPATSEECMSILRDLFQQALKTNAALIFQAMPGQVAVAVADILFDDDPPCRIGVIISKPGPRPAKVKREFAFTAHFGDVVIEIGSEAVLMAKTINPRAEVKNDRGVVSVVVDPPAPFEFSHIEWF